MARRERLNPRSGGNNQQYRGPEGCRRVRSPRARYELSLCVVTHSSPVDIR